MTFVAYFLDGPSEGDRHDFVGADAPFADLYMIPSPTHPDGPLICVGYTGLEPSPPWPNQVHYRLTAVGSSFLDDETTGDYVLSDD